MDFFTLLFLLLLTFLAGYITHWFRTRRVRRQLRDAEARLGAIEAQVIRVRRRGWWS